jgi:hypothetical protein
MTQDEPMARFADLDTHGYRMVDVRTSLVMVASPSDVPGQCRATPPAISRL